MTDVTAYASPAANTVGDEIRALRDNDVAMVSTFDSSDRLAALSAISNATPLAEMIGKKFAIANIVVQEVTLTDDETGEVQDAARTVLVTPTGEAYAAVSKGVLTSVRNILGVLGDPSTWDGPVEVTPLTKGRAPRAYTTLEIHGFAKK